MRELVQYRLENAEEKIRASECLLDADMYKDSINRSYYAIFSSLRALLATRDIDFSKHSGVISYFQREYIKTGVLDKSLSDIVTVAFQVRNKCDYDDFYIVSKNDACIQLDNARFLLGEIKKYIEKVI